DHGRVIAAYPEDFRDGEFLRKDAGGQGLVVLEDRLPVPQLEEDPLREAGAGSGEGGPRCLEAGASLHRNPEALALLLPGAEIGAAFRLTCIIHLQNPMAFISFFVK